jgi:RNA polymerase sigma factor (sigma-70 family)
LHEQLVFCALSAFFFVSFAFCFFFIFLFWATVLFVASLELTRVPAIYYTESFFAAKLPRGGPPVKLCAVVLPMHTESLLVENLQKFVAFARSKLRDPHLAEDVVQESLLKALAADRKPASDEDTIAWFYRILRRSIIDLYRRTDARNRALESFQAEFSEAPDPATEAEICRCFRALMADLPTQYRTLLERIDLGGETIPQVASALGERPNNVTVRLHRARKQLKARVEQLCKVCSVHGCLDCACEDTPDCDTSP